MTAQDLLFLIYIIAFLALCYAYLEQTKKLHKWYEPYFEAYLWSIRISSLEDWEETSKCYTAFIYSVDNKQIVFKRLYKTRASAIRGVFNFMDNDATNWGLYNQREVFAFPKEN